MMPTHFPRTHPAEPAASDPPMKITGFQLHRLRLPLWTPYKLAFGPVEGFDTVLVQVRTDDGAEGFGEATILTGYTPETIDQAWTIAGALAGEMIGRDSGDAKAHALARHHEAPFTVTALVTAVEMAEGSPHLAVDRETPVSLLAILNATDPEGIAAEVENHVADGYTTIKVKVGFEWEADARRLRFIQGLVARQGLPPGRLKLRLDGNQGFSRDDALAFTRALQPDHIELFEQPCHMDDWDAAKAVAEIAPVPMMLDESIYGMAEIDRAAELGAARYIKLKLMKAGSLDNLSAQLAHIREMGMEPVLGNGVASDPGCWMEACAARAHITNAGEMNGFLKPRDHLFETPLTVADGAMILQPGTPRLIDATRLDALAEASLSVGEP